jgi:hypothetical protein
MVHGKLPISLPINVTEDWEVGGRDVDKLMIDTPVKPNPE